jgi:hypothetical protein
MVTFLGRALIISFLVVLAGMAAIAQTTGQGAKPAPAADAPSNKTAAPATATSELIGLLPASDLIAVLDVGRAFNELLPKLAGFSAGGIDKIAKNIQDFTQQTGLDPMMIQNLVFGFSMDGPQGIGVLVLQGIDPDDKQIEALMKVFGTEYNKSEYKGKALYNVVSKVKPPSAGPLSVKTDELAVAALGKQRVVFGDLAAVKQVIDIHSGEAKGGVTAAMTGALAETRSSALVRFALNIPEGLRAEASTQGDLFKSVAAVKMILGTFDVANDLGLSLDTIVRTGSQSDAVELENGLKGLKELVGAIFGGGSGDPTADFIGKLLGQVKIGSKLADVTLSISLPRSLMDELTKKSPADEKKPAPEEKKPEPADKRP